MSEAPPTESDLPSPSGNQPELAKRLIDFGILLRDRRDTAHLTRMQLGALAGVSDTTIKFVEAGNAGHPPTRRTLLRLLAVARLGLRWEDLPLPPGAPRPTPAESVPVVPDPEPLYGIRPERELASVLQHCCAVEKPPSSFVFRNAVATVLLHLFGKVGEAEVKASLDSALLAAGSPAMPACLRLEHADRLRGTASAIAWLLGTLATDTLEAEIDSVPPAVDLESHEQSASQSTEEPKP